MKRTLCILLSLMLAVTGFAGLAVPASAEGTGSSAIKTITDGELVAYNYASLTDAEKAVLTSGQVIGDSYTYSVPGSGVDLVSIDTDAKTITAANYADTVSGLTWVPTTGRVVWSDGSEKVTFNSGTASYNYEGGPFTAEVAYTATIDVRTNLQKALLNGPVYLAKGLDALAAFSGQIDVYDTVAVYFNVYSTLLPYIGDENAKKAITDLDIEIGTYGSVAILDFALEYEDAGDKVAYLFNKGPAFKDAAMSFFGKIQTIYDDPEVITAINNHLSGTQMNNAQRLNGYLGQFLADTMVAADGGWEIFETAKHTFKVDADTELLGTLAAAISNRSLHDDAIVSDLAVPTEVIEIVVEQTAPSSLSTDISVLTNGFNTADAATVWYGGSAWRVIGYNGEGVASETGTATLLASGNMGHAYFNDGSNGNTNKYDGSTLKSKIDDIAALFSAVERGAISKRTLIKGGYDGANTDCIAGDADLADQLLWPLSIKEAYALNDTLRKADPEHPTWGSSYWWLRSPGIMEDRDCVAFIVGVGYVNEDGRSASSEETGVRPAFRINLQSVLFTSAAEGGKQGDGTLSPFGDYTGSEWKLTVLDADRSGFTASCASTNGDVRTVKYSGAKTGDNEYISAIIVDGDGAVTYYGRLCKAKAGSNKTAVVDVSGKMNEGDKLYVFNEQYNGDKKTDFSSALVDVTPNLGSGMTVNIEDLKQGLNTLDAKTVWYGGSKWRVIGYDGAGAASTADTMTLFANGSMGTTMFDQDGNTQKRYSGSDLEKQTKQIYNNAFSGPEQLAVKDTTLGSGTYDGANTDGVEGSSVGYARLWPLSTREANAVNADLRKDSGDWWLRSPGDGSNNVAFVTKQGNVDHSGRSFRSELGVRPAFYVDLDRVIFASAAVGGKQGDGALTPIDGYPGNEWKLTVWEGNHRWFTVNETDVTARPGSTLTLHYQYAETGENEYISAIVTDENGNALYYGRIAPATTEDGTVQITIPADLEKGAFSLYVFNEQVNGDKKTDYAGKLIEVVKAEVVAAASLKTGDTFEMGMYPQTRVTDDATITALNAIDCTMTNYGYMQNSNADNHTYDAVDMTYVDIAYNGQAYRKVTINEYRPYFTVLPSSSSNTYQADNGYVTGNTYYFKWEPIVWQVLARESDGVYVMSQSLLDSPSYHNYLEFSTWETSSLRTWMNEGFYNGAFSEGERSKLISCTLSNVCDNPFSIDDGGNDTTDKLWVLSFSDSIDSAYGFQDRNYSDPAKEAAGTDYAKSQGLSADPSNGCSIWWLRSPGEGVPCGSGINENGYGPCNPRRDSTEIGVRPAFKLSLDAAVGTADSDICRIAGHSYGDWSSADADNHKRVCSVCGAEETAAHSFEPTSRYCLDGCGAENPDYTGTPASILKTGDTFEMGMYPQTRVTDDATIAALNAIDCTMTNYGYMQKSNAESQTFEPVDMSYADIQYNGETYRKVTINQYRPNYTMASFSKNHQETNGYTTGTYYFKWEPIEWQVLAGESDGVYVMSKALLDSQAYNNYNLTTTTWEDCSLRTWLNDGFYATAFSEAEQAKINATDLVNEDGPVSSGLSGGNDTTDHLWVLSYSDAINSAYGFNTDAATYDGARKAQGTDYAKSQGIYTSSGFSDWRLRTPGGDTTLTCKTLNSGSVSYESRITNTDIGVRPAFKLNLDATVGTSDPKTLIQDPNLTMENQETVYGETITLTATLAQNAAGTVDFTVTKDAFTATYSANIENGAATVSLPVLDAGTYSVTAEYAGHGNFDAGTASATLTVNQKAVSVRVTGPDGPYKQYNGQEQSHTDTVVWIYDRDESGLDEAKLRYTGNTTVKGTNAGRYETALSADDCVCDDSNFDVTFTAQGTICMTIGQTALDITADSKETNHGEDLAALTYTIKSNHNYYYNEAELEISISTDADKNKPGSYEITVTVQDNPNYAIRVFGGTYTVGNSPHTWGGVTYTWTGTASVKAERKCVYCEEVETETKATTSQQTKAPTCTANGETTYTAVFDNPAFETKTKTVADIDALNHDWKTEWSKDGVNHWHDCTRCDEKNDEAAHTYGDVSYTWEQTRGAWKATAKRACTVCEWEETETVNATGSETKPATCTVNGETTYTAQFENAAFETQQKTVADIAALDHDWKTAWSKDGVNHWHDCTRCDEKNDEAAHTYGDVSYTWEQTRGAWKATAKHACTVCEWEETETVNATGAQSKAPTCTVNGETTYTATFSNPAFTTQTKTVDDIAALDHAYDAVVTEPTCTEDGYTTHTCSRCGDSYTDSETDALGHVWGDWEIVRTATPNEKGEKKRVCTRCGEVETAEIDELILTSSVDGQTGSSLVVTVPYAKRGAIATTLTAEEPVTYTSSNPKLLTVDENGNVQFVRLCIFCKSATITTVSADGSKVATCKVNIEIKWWQYIIWFFLGSLWF